MSQLRSQQEVSEVRLREMEQSAGSELLHALDGVRSERDAELEALRMAHRDEVSSAAAAADAEVAAALKRQAEEMDKRNADALGVRSPPPSHPTGQFGRYTPYPPPIGEE